MLRLFHDGWAWLAAAGLAGTAVAAEPATGAKPGKAVPAGVRRVTVKGFAAYPPIFAIRTGTLDPLDLARESWKGWISKRGIPWGMRAGLGPTLRLSFDCWALPWSRCLLPATPRRTERARQSRAKGIGSHAPMGVQGPRAMLHRQTVGASDLEGKLRGLRTGQRRPAPDRYLSSAVGRGQGNGGLAGRPRIHRAMARQHDCRHQSAGQVDPDVLQAGA